MRNNKIIYIIGAGRSGTTLLDIILGNQEGVYSAGELNRYPKRKGLSTLKDSAPSKKSIWAAFKKELDTLGYSDYPNLYRLVKKFEYHSFFFRLGKAGATRYFNYLNAFFETLSKEVPANNRYIVDSSKYPARALHLSSLFKSDISFIFLRREPVSVVSSFAKADIEQPPKGFLAANLYYLVVNILCYYTVRKLSQKHKVSIVNYEDLVNRPTDTLTKLENDLGISFQDVKEKIRHDENLVVGDLFDGNRIRQEPFLRIKMENKTHRKSLKAIFTRILNGPVYKLQLK